MDAANGPKGCTCAFLWLFCGTFWSLSFSRVSSPLEAKKKRWDGATSFLDELASFQKSVKIWEMKG
jgi:hypothetical protein